MNTLVNSFAVSPSSGDMRADGLMQWAPKMPQDRFADIPILADANEQARSDSNADGDDDPGTDVHREEDTQSARKRDRATADGSHAATAAIASDSPAELPVQARSGADNGDSTSARSSKAAGEGTMPAASLGAEQKKQAALVGQLGKNGQDTQTAAGAIRKNGESGTPVAGQSTTKGGLVAPPRTLDESSQKALSRKQSPPLEASPKSEARLQGPGSENQSGAGLQRSGLSGHLNPAMEALLSGGKESQPGGHKSGASTPAGPSAYFVSQPVAAAPHSSVETVAYGSADGGVGESISQSVGDQILDSLKASMAQGDRQVLIRLQPPELGMVLVRFREQGQTLDGTLKVERTDTRREIEQVLPEVVRSLQDAGIGIRRLDVTGNESAEQDLGPGQPRQDGSSAHGDTGQDRNSLWTSSTLRPAAAVDSTRDPVRVPDLQGSAAMPQGRIDMLL